MLDLEKILKKVDKDFSHEEIDEFLNHLTRSLEGRIKYLEKEEEELSPEQFECAFDMEAYRSHLSYFADSAYSALALGDELSIIALYKKVERHINRIVKRKVPEAAEVNLTFFNKLCGVLPFDINVIDSFAGFDELRLLNNSIKHGGKVSNELALKYPNWTEGADLTELGVAYQRLLPEIKKYVSEFVEKLYDCTS